MEGTRKFKAWIITEIIICLIFGSSLYVGVKYTPDSITTIILIVASISGAFFGANFGEHWTKVKK